MLKRLIKKKWLRRAIYFVLFLVLLLVSTVSRMDYTPLKETEYYAESKEILDQIKIPDIDTGQVFAGWSKVNITPDFPFKVVGFGKNEIADGVLDSTYLRAVVFKQSQKTVAYLSYELMIVHPLIKKSVEKELANRFPEVNHVYFTATHTHNAIGGYGDHLSGYFALGGYDQRIVDLLVEATMSSISTALDSLEPVSYAHYSGDFPDLVRNRINKKDGKVDGELNVLFLEKQSGENASISTFSAHPTMLPRRYNYLSGDYPSYLMDSLEKSGVADFAIFSAGPVGSHKPKGLKLAPESLAIYARDLLWAHQKIMVEERSLKPLKKLFFLEYGLPLREAHFKLGYGFRIEPWLFELIFGEAEVNLSYLMVGDVVFVGTPCDFSGELALDIKDIDRRLKPVITSFNGGYIGYITPDKYYEWDTHEVRDVNWFGPYNGAYFKETINETLDKLNYIK